MDYDNVRFHLSTQERKTVLLLSMNIRCWGELVQYGALEVLQREYGALLSNETEPDYNVSLQIDLEQVPVDQGLLSPPIFLFQMILVECSFQNLEMHSCCRSHS